jgi:adenine C2-methylase RlmN of 23S rRNA A2503 and tRNA A37
VDLSGFFASDELHCRLPCQVTVSTVGLVDKLEVFAASPNAPHMALSLHATTDEARPQQCL